MAPTNALGIMVLSGCMLFPLVEASFCGPPPLPTNAAIRSESSKPTSSGYNEGTLILYTCKPGYQRLSGLVFVKCLGTTWTKSTFICVASKKCRSPRVPKHGKKFGSAYSVGQRVRFSCNTGFDLQGAAVIECLKNKTWSKAVPMCKVVDCGSLSAPTHGKKIKETKTTFGGRADFICRNKRYSIVGSRRRFCQANGEWSGKPTLCKGIPVHFSLVKEGHAVLAYGTCFVLLSFSAMRRPGQGVNEDSRGRARPVERRILSCLLHLFRACHH